MLPYDFWQKPPENLQKPPFCPPAFLGNYEKSPDFPLNPPTGKPNKTGFIAFLLTSFFFVNSNIFSDQVAKLNKKKSNILTSFSRNQKKFCESSKKIPIYFFRKFQKKSKILFLDFPLFYYFFLFFVSFFRKVKTRRSKSEKSPNGGSGAEFFLASKFQYPPSGNTGCGPSNISSEVVNLSLRTERTLTYSKIQLLKFFHSKSLKKIKHAD